MNKYPETVKEYIIELDRAVDAMYNIDMPKEVADEFVRILDLIYNMADLIGFDLSKE